jgi:hypothetical protein
MSQSRECILTIVLGLTLVSCSGPKTISRDELRSDLLAAISLASETQLFINQLQGERVTPAFANGHLGYLSTEASRLDAELRQAKTDEGLAAAHESGRPQLDSLTTMLADLINKTAEQESLFAGRQRAARIRLILEHTKDEL